MHPVRNRMAIKANFTEKVMVELKSLGKRLQEKRHIFSFRGYVLVRILLGSVG